MPEMTRPAGPERTKESLSTNDPRLLSRAEFLRLAAAAGAGLGGIVTAGTSVHATGHRNRIDTPVLTSAQVAPTYIELQLCAPAGRGATGLPGGFSIQRMTQADFVANGGWFASNDPRLCKASFSGRPCASRYDLRPGGCVTVRIGDLLLDTGASANCTGALVCDTAYVFRAFGHATSRLYRSAFTADVLTTTAQCSSDSNCTLSSCYWPWAFPVSANCVGFPTNGDFPWPVDTLFLGTVSYTICDMVATMRTFFEGPNAENALITIARQLIPVKLNIARGADGTDVAQAVLDADALIADLVVPPKGTGYIATSAATNALAQALNDFNAGFTGPGNCGANCPD